MKRILTKSMFIILMGLSCIYAVDKTGTTAAKFLSIGVGSKAVAMGGAFTSIADDATAMYWNPAGLSYFNTKELYFKLISPCVRFYNFVLAPWTFFAFVFFKKSSACCLLRHIL